MVLTTLIATTAVATGTLDSRPVQFKVGNEKIVGTVYLPKTRPTSGKLPAVIVTGAWFTVKEQMPTTYARAFAERGYAAMVFDFRGFGGSEGKARNTENPTTKTEDIRAAAAFLARQPYVDAKRLSGFAQCASIGYMAGAIAAGAPLRAFATSALWVQDAGAVEAVYGGKQGVEALLKTGDEAKTAFQETGTVRDVPAAGAPGSDAIMQEAPYYTDPNRGKIAAWSNRFALMSWSHWLRFDSLAPARKITVPTLVMHSDRAALPDMTRRFYADLAGPKAIYWSDEAHMDFYDSPRIVARSTGLAIAHFDRFLSPAKAAETQRIEEAVRQVANEVDAKAWSAAQQRFTPEVTVDYRSLGGELATLPSKQLIENWEKMHARYATTRHEYFNFSTVINGDEATTTHEGMATLSHGGKRWSVGGDYTVGLTKLDGRWLVRSIKFDLRWQHGDR